MEAQIKQRSKFYFYTSLPVLYSFFFHTRHSLWMSAVQVWLLPDFGLNKHTHTPIHRQNRKSGNLLFKEYKQVFLLFPLLHSSKVFLLLLLCQTQVCDCVCEISERSAIVVTREAKERNRRWRWCGCVGGWSWRLFLIQILSLKRCWKLNREFVLNAAIQA